MAGTVEKKLQELGITLQEPRAPMANYVPFVRTGNLLHVSGQVCLDGEGKLVAKGRLGDGVVHRRRTESRARLRDQSVGASQGRARRSRQSGARRAARRLHQFGAGISPKGPK